MLSRVRRLLTPGSSTGGKPERERVAQLPPRLPIGETAAYTLLKNSRRRAVIAHLDQPDTQPPVTVRELSTVIAAEENDCHPDAVGSKERKRVYVTLLQSHLPKLDTWGVIEYDGAGSEVWPTEHVHRLAVIRDATTRHLHGGDA